MTRSYRFATFTALILGVLIVAMLAGASTATAQTAPIQKDPVLATTLSVIFAGGGQLYANKPGKALAEIGAVIVGASVAGRGQTAGVFLAFGGWAWGVVTASDDARAYNGRSAQPVRIEPYRPPGRDTSAAPRYDAARQWQGYRHAAQLNSTRMYPSSGNSTFSPATVHLNRIR